ncbi:hypothetical protein NP493_9062g00000 [Ridgeia piscesae]|uniref:Uncharacterized protein n=1 Tax=Ridgeia piscesae TaxID=27915 RepID=A0AAD9IM96_RIDPI|nr:hypothetical protein NP493_9062g00000 [Ridgeia piscesae]
MFCHLLFSHCSPFVIKNHRINQLIIGISESVQDLILCRSICGYCNVLCTRNLNLIELFHRPHRVPQTIFPQLLNKSTFAWLLHVGVCYCTQEICILLHHSKGPPKTQSNTGDLVFEKIP